MSSRDLDLHVDLLRTVLWQYEGAPRLKALVQAEQDAATENHTRFWRNWQRDVFNLRTANAFGLSVWSKILNISLSISRPANVTGNWGFGAHHRNFGRGNFGRLRDGAQAVTESQARRLLLIRWAQITSRPSVPQINAALAAAFGKGQVYCHDHGDMRLTYYFTTMPPYQTIDLVRNTGILPRPAAVQVDYVIQPRPSWGLGIHHLNFGRGNFGRRESI